MLGNACYCCYFMAATLLRASVRIESGKLKGYFMMLVLTSTEVFDIKSLLTGTNTITKTASTIGLLGRRMNFNGQTM